MGRVGAADFYWLFSQFNENYAPLELKQQRYGFNYEQLKAKYLADAQATKNNDEFYKLMFQFVSEFKDAHTSASLTASQLPARAKVAYLGFSGKRVGETLVVTELLPTIKADKSEFPIKVGDHITKIDGITLRESVVNEQVKFRNLGNEESNVTYHMNKIFNRVSTANGLPAGDTAVLTVMREKKERQVALPWVVKDLFVFNQEQKAATKKANSSDKGEEAVLGSVFQLGFLRYDGKIEPSASIMQTIVRELPNFSFWNTFRFVDSTPVWAAKLLNDPTVVGGNNDDTLKGAELLGADRKTPKHAVPVTEAKTFPAYVTREKIVGKDGKATGATKLVAYMYLNTFSPKTAEPEVMKEIQATLDQLKVLGATDLIIDMINNGGGSLTLGMKIAQTLSKEKVVQPDIQFRLSETWLDNFEKGSLLGDSDAERELSRRIFETFKADQALGKRLSRRLSVESLEPFGFVANDKLDTKLNIVLLVNEMCASMCDIFTGIMKDNGLARVVGTKTMGAGGNVVDHYEAPNSHLTVRQTESLIVRTGANDGVYIENNGVEPDVEVRTADSTMEKYEPVRVKALELLLTETK
ncbi:MAG: hypothetical protein HY074_00665 [Deltaproteobacteria bacterium]|nr:hypothetical protein [Deltaproteobacteria bacterium]